MRLPAAATILEANRVYRLKRNYTCNRNMPLHWRYATWSPSPPISKPNRSLESGRALAIQIQHRYKAVTSLPECFPAACRVTHTSAPKRQSHVSRLEPNVELCDSKGRVARRGRPFRGHGPACDLMRRRPCHSGAMPGCCRDLRAKG